jgi:hypothetical protein
MTLGGSFCVCGAAVQAGWLLVSFITREVCDEGDGFCSVQWVCELFRASAPPEWEGSGLVHPGCGASAIAGPHAGDAILLSEFEPSRLLRAHFFPSFRSQKEGSFATHCAAGMLNSGRTAKILSSGPTSAWLLVFAAVTTNRKPS